MNVVGQRLKCIASEKTAFTHEDGAIVRWSPDESGETQVFQAKSGEKLVLKSDAGAWWNRTKQEAENCFYAEAWFGDFPYGSWGYGFRVCKHTNAVHVEGFETEINPRGLTGQDRFRQDCKTYAYKQQAAQEVSQNDSR